MDNTLQVEYYLRATTELILEEKAILAQLNLENLLAPNLQVLIQNLVNLTMVFSVEQSKLIKITIKK